MQPSQVEEDYLCFQEVLSKWKKQSRYYSQALEKSIGKNLEAEVWSEFRSHRKTRNLSAQSSWFNKRLKQAIERVWKRFQREQKKLRQINKSETIENYATTSVEKTPIETIEGELDFPIIMRKVNHIAHRIQNKVTDGYRFHVAFWSFSCLNASYTKEIVEEVSELLKVNVLELKQMAINWKEMFQAELLNNELDARVDFGSIPMGGFKRILFYASFFRGRDMIEISRLKPNKAFEIAFRYLDKEMMYFRDCETLSEVIHHCDQIIHLAGDKKMQPDELTEFRRIYQNLLQQLRRIQKSKYCQPNIFQV